MLRKKLFGMASQKLINFIVIIAIISNTTNCEMETYICPLRLGTVIEKNKKKLQKSQILTWEIMYEIYKETAYWEWSMVYVIVCRCLT